MSVLRAIALSTLCVVLAGCNVRPLPQDFTSVGTTQIVTQIRCETYNALLERFAKLVSDGEAPEDGSRPTAKRGTAARLLKGDLRFQDISANDVGPALMRLVDRYKDVTVGYSFFLDMTERNNLSGSLGFERPFARGPLAIGVAAQSDRSRQNVRTFRIVDDWSDLLRDEESSNHVTLDKKISNFDLCRNQKDSKVNLDVPINGKIGMATQIATFYNLYQTGNLTGIADEIPTMTDTVSFVSLVRGAVSPSITIGPLSDAFRLASAGGTAEIRREDTHKVIIVIAAPPRDKTKEQPAIKSVVNQELLRREDNENFGGNQVLIRRLADQLRSF